MDDNRGSPTPWPETSTGMATPIAVGRKPRRLILIRALGWILVAMTIAALVGGGLAITQSRRADARTRKLEFLAHQLDRDQRALAAVIETTNHRADGPIGKSEQVANALSRIDEVAGNVFVEANRVEDELGRAVALENGGGPGAGRSIYDGTAADAVRRLQTVLQGAQATLAAAEQAAADLRASAP
ncbi:MAG: hypothetical protein ABIP21_09655 [Acidimicrobiia bacterium]